MWPLQDWREQCQLHPEKNDWTLTDSTNKYYVCVCTSLLWTLFPPTHPVSWPEWEDSPSWRVWGWAARASLVETGSLLVESFSYCWHWGQTWWWSWRPVKGKRMLDQISQSAVRRVAMVTAPKKCYVMALRSPHFERCDRRQTSSDSVVRCQSPGQRCAE